MAETQNTCGRCSHRSSLHNCDVIHKRVEWSKPACDDYVKSKGTSKEKRTKEKTEPENNLCDTCFNMRTNSHTGDDFCAEQHKIKYHQENDGIYHQDVVSECKDYKNKWNKKVDNETKEPEGPETPQHIKDRAKDIMENGDPVEFLFNTHQKEHVGDEIISKTLIVGVGVQSAANTGGIQPKLDGASGMGKSHSAKAFMKFIPLKYKIEGSCSDKVLFYKKDMLDGSIVYSDDISISEDMTTTIKRATTNFQELTAHYTLSKDREPETHYLPKRIMWLLTSVENNQSIQLLNRQFGGSVDESLKQDDDVFDHQVMNCMLGKVEFSESEDVLVCREIIKDIKSHLFTVVIPYSYLIEWKNKDNRRNYTMFTDMIAAFAIYRYKQRKVEDNYLFAELQDFDDAENLYSQRNVAQRTKLSDTEQKICNYLASVESADTKSIQDATGLSSTRISQLMHGKTDTDTGLLCKVKGLTVEDVTVDKEVEETGRKKGDTSVIVVSKGKARKKVYTLVGYNYNEYKESVVSIGDTERKEYERLNHDLTTALLLKIKNSGELLTYLTKFNNIHSNGKYVKRLLDILTPENGVKKVNNSQPIAKEAGLSRGKTGYDLTSEVVEFLKNEYSKKSTQYKPSEISYAIGQKFKKLDMKSCVRFADDYCKSRGW